MWLSISKKVFVAITVTATATMLILLYLGISFMQKRAADAAGRQQLLLAQTTLDTVDALLYGNYHQIQSLATDDALAQYTAHPVTATQDSVTARLNQITAGGAWEEIEIIDGSGNVVASTNSTSVGRPYAADATAAATVSAARSGQSVVSDATIQTITNQPAMYFAAPVGGASSAHAKMVVFGVLDWSNVTAILQKNTSNYMNMSLYTSQGTRLSNIGPAEADTQSIFAQAAHRARGSETTTGTNPALVSYDHEDGLNDYKGNRWVLVVSMSSRQAFIAANRYGSLMPWLFIGMIVVAVMGGMLLLNRIVVRHVRHLTSLTKNIAVGDLTLRAHIHTHDEFGQLAQAFNRMTDKLQEMYRDLEAKVQAKTKELGQRVIDAETARARDEAIMAGMGEGLVAIDHTGNVSLVNVSAAHIFGTTRDKIFGRPLGESLADLRTHFDAPIAADHRPEVVAAQGRDPIDDVYIYHPKNGRPITLNIIATPIFRDGQGVGVVLVVRDVTKEKEVDRMKTEFISLASHQLRTPLSAIKWFSEMLLGGDAGPLNPDQTEFAQNVAQSTQRMIELVSSLLNISRIESGRIIVAPKPTDLKELVSNIVQDLHAKIEQRHQHLVINVHDGLPKVNLDPQLIGQVYLNLLTNAIKYTPENGEITVFVSRKDNEIIAQITDSGYGIPLEQQDKLFQKFFRASNVAKVETDGTGLGLYLVKAIIESSGGKIWFKSEENKGTTFWFSLPMSGMQAKEGEVTLEM